MALILGIDTSNYTTSCALYNTEDKSIIQKKQLLPVKSGECGIRQSDAVFHHTKQLPALLGSSLRCRLHLPSAMRRDRACVRTSWYLPLHRLR